jgi:adenosyl cobinamide kinase/adenosyl cobinamide phosphate guanylyltransferase
LSAITDWKHPPGPRISTPPPCGRHANIPDPALITLVLGGARSGKSRYAEAVVTRHPAPWTYIATAEIKDEEMRARVAEHQARRAAGWHTVEVPIDLAGALARAPRHPVLVDCLTLWLTNLILGRHDIVAATTALEAALERRERTTVLVSNEVGLGLVPDNKLGRAFRDEAGILNQRIAARASHVLFMAAGLPLTLK